jgi:RHS repeat-associated protein
MRVRSFVLLITAMGVLGIGRLVAQTPVLSGIEGPYPAVQTSGTIHVAGGVYGSGAVAYGPVGTPLVVTGSDLGASGIVEFVPYHLNVQTQQEVAGTPVTATPTLWTSNMVFVTVPAGAATGLVVVEVEGKTSSPGLPFIVTSGTYAGTCPAFPPSNQLQITTSSLHDGTAGQAYSATLGAIGGSQSYTWAITSGTLPSGLSLNATTGVISGTPTGAAGPVPLTIQVMDGSSPKQANEALLDLTVESQTMTASTVYSYCVPGPSNASCTSSTSGYDGVGNVLKYQDSVMGTWNFSYDPLNRLANGNATSGDFSTQLPYACWSYDNYGNRLQQEMSSAAFITGSGGANTCQPQSSASVTTDVNSYLNGSGVDPGTNQVLSTNAPGVTAAPGYDTAGDYLCDNYNPSTHTCSGPNVYLYDAEGRICAVQRTLVLGVTTMTGYLYNAEGQRVAKGTISNMNTCDPAPVSQGGNGFQLTQSYVLGQGGEELTTLDGSNNWQRTNVYGAGKLIATYDMVPDPTNTSPTQVPALHFHLTDPLGSRRMQTTSVGQPETDCQNLPFGDQLYCYPDAYAAPTADDATPLHFTGKERDAESGNDYFGARYYASTMGRFLSPDDFWKDSHVADPQSWNLYAYARNNPLRYIDPTGNNATVSTSCSTDSNNHTSCNVNISASIAIYAVPGSGLSSDQMNDAASTIKNSIESTWSGNFDKDGVSYSVSTSISVQVAGSAADASGTGAQNVIGLTNGAASLNPNGPSHSDDLTGPPNSLRTFLRGQDTGIWDYQTLGGDLNGAAHEFTHMLGDADHNGCLCVSNSTLWHTPQKATGEDFGWGLLEATRAVNTTLNRTPISNPVFAVPTPSSFSNSVHVGAPLVNFWWK